MGDSLTMVVVIILAGILIFVFPMSAMAERGDDISQLTAQTAVTEFVNTTRNTGRITNADYDKLVASLNSTGNTYDITIEILVIDENPAKKGQIISAIQQGGSSTDKHGENLYYSIYTTQIMDELDQNGVKYMKQGDVITVSAANSNNTISQMFKGFLYGLTGNNVYSILATDSGQVTVTGK